MLYSPSQLSPSLRFWGSFAIMTSFCPRLTAAVGLSQVRCGPRQLPERTIELIRNGTRHGFNRRSIVLRSPSYERRRVLTVVEAAEPSRLRMVERSDGGEEEKLEPCFYPVRDQSAEDLTGNNCAIADSLSENDCGTRNRTVEVVVAAAATVVFGVGNRVLYKLALVPLKHYPFFLAQLSTFGYVIVYFSILYIRYHAGIVTDEMLSMPKAPFLAVGLLEALGAATGMAAAAILSGTSIPILSQSFLVWQIILSIIFLRRRYKVNQLLGCFLVGIGVIITVASGSSAGQSLMEAGIFWSCLMIVSFLFQAADTVLKEIIFLNACRQLKGKTVDLFVVNSFGSAFQALFLFALLPFLSRLWGIPFSQLPNYMLDGAACFLNLGSGTLSGCDGAPLLPLLFIIVNMGYNISLLYLLKISSAVVSSLASTFSVPISIYLFTLPLPYIGVASPLPTGFVNGAIILVIGLLIYTLTPSRVSNTLPINQKVAVDSAPFP